MMRLRRHANHVIASATAEEDGGAPGAVTATRAVGEAANRLASAQMASDCRFYLHSPV